MDTLTKYDIAIEDKQYKVELKKTENQRLFMIKIDDKPYSVELENKFEYDRPLQIRLNETTFTIQIAKNEKNALFQIKVKGIPINAEVKTQQINSYRQPVAALTPTSTKVTTLTSKPATEGTISAPMAGKIVSIKVKKGDAVKANAVVCILEAMKMENEILAQKDGFVKEILVSAGAGVNKGDPMFIIEPSEN